MSRTDVRYINIHALSNGSCKDFTDLMKTYSDQEWILKDVLAGGTSIRSHSPVKPVDVFNRTLKLRAAAPHPRSVYELLPSGLKAMTGLLKKPHMKDVFLNAAFAVIAGHMANVKIPHQDGLYSPDIFILIIAEPGSGKGGADKGKRLGYVLNNELLKDSEKEIAKWDQLPDDLKKSTPRPRIRQLFLPGNSSARAVIDFLVYNEGRGLMFENEIDSLQAASNQEWGNFSDIIRKAFHHEGISLNRKDDVLNLQRPELSIFMSGTFDQFRNMFPSAENGHFSRYAFYTFTAPLEWHTHRPTQESRELDTLIDAYSEKLYRMHQILSKRDAHLLVKLEDHHWDQIDSVSTQNMARLKDERLNRHLQSSNKRAAVIALRITAIVSLLRAYDNFGEDVLSSDSIMVTDDDLHIGLELGSNFFDHAIRLFYSLPKTKTSGVTGKVIDAFYRRLPKQFERKVANFIGHELKITSRTVTTYLNNLVEAGLLTKEKHGEYNKLS